MKARVLYCEEKQKKIICTLKKNLLNSQLPKLFDYKLAIPGLLSHGYIASIKDYGLIVEFYNKTHGLVSTQDLVRTSFLKEGQVPSDAFKRGDVHKVRVVHCDAKKQRLKLSLGLVAPKGDAESADDPNSIEMRAAPGTIVAGTVKEVKQDGLLLTLEDESDTAEPVKPTKGKKAAPAKAKHTIFLPTGQLTDHPSLADALHHTYPVGHKFDKLVVLHTDKSLKLPVVSAKSSLLAVAAGGAEAEVWTLPSSYDTLQPGSLLIGFVRSITNYGVFIGFLDHVSGLAPRNHLSDQFIAGDLKDSFQVGQTVRAKVVTIENVEAENGLPATTKLTLTLKPSQIAEDQPESNLALDGTFVSTFFAETARVGSSLPSSGDAASSVDWSAYPLAGTFIGTIKVIKDFGLVLEGGEGSSVQGLVTRPYHTSEPATKKELLATSSKKSATTESEISSESGEKYSLGQQVSGRILDADHIKKIVDVSLRSELVSTPSAVAAAPAKKGKKAAPAVTGSSLAGVAKCSWVPVRVQLVRKQYVVLSLPQHGNAIGYALTTNTNSRFNPHSVFQPGHETKALVHQLASEKNGNRTLLILDLNSALQTYSKNKKAASSTQGVGGGVTFIDSSLTKLSELQNGRKLTVQIRGLSRGADPSTAGPNSRLEAIVGEVNHKVLIGSIHISQIEDALHERAASGDKDAKKVLKDHATKPYSPLVAWATRIGEQVPARILNITRKVSATRTTKNKGPKTHIATIDLTIRPSVIKQSKADEDAEQPTPIPHITAADLHEGQIVQSYVKDIEQHADARDGVIWTVIAPGLKGRIRANELSFPKEVKLDSFKVGQALTAQVLELHADARLVDLVLLPLGTAKAKKLDAALVEQCKQAAHHTHEVKVGSIIRDLTVKQVLANSLIVSYGSSASHQKLARIHITDVADKWTKSPLDAFKVGQAIPKAVVIDVSAKEETKEDEDEEDGDNKESKVTTQIDLSIRPSRLAPKSAPKPKFAEVTSLDDLIGKDGTIVQGYVRTTSKVGCFISLSHSVTARCLLKNLSDGYVTDPIRHFPPGKFLAHVKIVKVDPDNRTIEVSLRKGDGLKDIPAGESLYKFEDVKEGDNVRGVVTQIKPFGLFIRLKDSALSGLCHISEVSDTFIDDLSKHYEVGDKVRARIVKKDEGARKISLGLKAKYFTEPDSEDEGDEGEEDATAQSDDEEEEPEEQMIEEDDEEAPAKSKKSKGSKRKADSSEDEQEEEVEMDESRVSKKARAVPSTAAPLAAVPSNLLDDAEMDDAPALNLDLNSSFSMLTGGSSAKVESDQEESDLDEDDDDTSSSSKKQSRRAKAGAKKAEERALLSKEHAILDPNAQPESADEFERIIVQTPNASMVWIKYMAYQSQSNQSHIPFDFVCLLSVTTTDTRPRS